MMKKTILLALISNILVLTASADQTLSRCSPILRALTNGFLVEQAAKRGRLEDAELRMLYAVRDRILTNKNSQATTIKTNQEAQLISNITKLNFKVGSSFNMEQFETTLIKVNENFAFWLAGKFHRSHYHILEFEDLVQAAKIGLLLAIRNYKPDYQNLVDGAQIKANFSELAEMYMRNEIRYTIKESLALAVPNAQLLAPMLIVGHIAGDLTFQNKGKKPSFAAILAEYQRLYPDGTPLTMKKIENLLARKAALDSVFSIFEKEQTKEGDAIDAEVFLPANKETPETLLEKKQTSKLVMQLFDRAHLSHVQRKVLILFHGLHIQFDESNNYKLIDSDLIIEPKTLRAIGEQLGLSHEKVRLLNIEAIEAMAKAFKTYQSYTNLKETQKTVIETQIERIGQQTAIGKEKETQMQRLERYRQKYGDLLAD